MRKKKLVKGIGINDANYTVKPRVNGKQVTCPFYQVWVDMLERCYSAKKHSEKPTYIGCTVCDEWLKFSNFKKWMEIQNWQAKQLDKDLLRKGNKVYSPEVCVFVDGMTNSFTVDSGATRGEWPIGVCFHRRHGKFVSYCSNPFTGKSEHLGCFTCPEQAHLAWKRRKHELACQLADLQTDERVAAALRLRYA